MNKFIKVLEPKLQDELANLGFSYTIEKLGDKQVFAFTDSMELRKYIINYGGGIDRLYVKEI